MAFNLKLPIEIPFIALMFAFTLSGSVTINWLMYQSCDVTLHINKTDCLKLLSRHSDNFTKELEEKVQPYVTTINMTRTLLEAVFCAILCLFLGPWSDIYGRKPVLLLGLGANALGFIILTITTSIPNISPWFTVLASIPMCFSGGVTVILAVSVCYITDITTPENRGFRLAIFYLSMSAISVIGLVSSSFALELFGFLLVFSISSTILVISFLLMLFFLEESVINYQTEGKFSNLFKLSYVCDTLKVTLKKRENMDRTIIILIATILTLYFLCTNVDQLAYLYLRAKLSWSLEHFSLYSSVQLIMEVIGSGILIYVLNKLLKINESIVASIGLMSLIIGYIWFGLSTRNWHIYAAGSIRSLNAAVPPMLRSLVSKVVSSDDYGKIFSFIAIMEAIIGPIGSPLFTFIYNKTLTNLPGAYYFVAGGFTILSFFLCLIIVGIKARYKLAYSTLTSSDEALVN